jgi:hypothetical protein
MKHTLQAQFTFCASFLVCEVTKQKMVTCQSCYLCAHFVASLAKENTGINSQGKGAIPFRVLGNLHYDMTRNWE